jgi:hypothetical protein
VTVAAATTTGTALQSTSGTDWKELPGATTTIAVPAGTTATVDARFTAQSACYTVEVVVAEGSCSVRILVDGVEAQPAAGLDFVFDTAIDGIPSPTDWEAKAIERVLPGVGPGSHTVKVQMAARQDPVHVELDDWSLVVEALKTS